MPRESFQQELDALRTAVGELGQAADAQLGRSVAALTARDKAAAAAIRRDDRDINARYAEIEAVAVALIARQSPMAGDLRLVLAALATATELERIADHAADIAELVELASDAPGFEMPATMSELAQRARRMLDDALAAFDAGDETAARALGSADDDVDALEQMAYRSLLDRSRTDPSTLEAAVRLITAAHHLERVADRATNIGEQTVYAVTGVLDELNPSITAG